MEPNTLLLFMVLTSSAVAPTSEASYQAQRAYFTQSGIERNLQEWERRTISPEVRTRLGNLALVSKTLIDRRIEVRWTFE